MEQIRTGPVENRHEVVADDLDAKLGQIADALLIVLDVLVAGGQADLDVIVNIDRLNHVHIKAVGVDLIGYLLDLVHFPNLTGHFVVQRPDDAGHTGDLLDVAQADGIVENPPVLYFLLCIFRAAVCRALVLIF